MFVLCLSFIMESQKSISQRFKQLLFFLDKNRTELAKEISVTEPAISKTVKGTTLPSSKLLIPLGEKLGISADWLLFGVGDMYLSQKEASTITSEEIPKTEDKTKEGKESGKIRELEIELKHLKERLKEKDEMIRTKDKLIQLLEQK